MGVTSGASHPRALREAEASRSRGDPADHGRHGMETMELNPDPQPPETLVLLSPRAFVTQL
jgi:hypothetical protein